MAKWNRLAERESRDSWRLKPRWTEFLQWFWVLAAVTTAAHTALAGVDAQRVGSGFNLPVFATSPPGDTNRLFVLEQFAPGSLTTANIKILDLNNCGINGLCATNASPFLTITGLDTNPNDFAFQGTQGLAFHPNYASNGLFYVSFVGANEDTYVREYQVSAGDPNVANPTPVRNVITIDKNPGSRHNSAWLGFSPNDGLLYMTVGDSGGENDPHNNAQNLNNLNAKVLRLDVDGTDAFPGDSNRNYAIPGSNPFVNRAGADEIWAYGFRNPWRASFDRQTGDFYLGDVGANAREEVNVQPADHAGGLNNGWRLREGTIATPGVGGSLPGATDPIYDYTHGSGNSQGFSVTGGYVYRGSSPELQGKYFFADFTNERVWSLEWDGSAPSTHDGTNFTNFVDHTTGLAAVGVNQIVSFAEDGAGELYILDLGAGQTGEIFKIIPPGPDRVWAVNSSGVWHNDSNWSGGGQPNLLGTSATFGAAITSPRTVVTEVDVTVSSVIFDNANEYVLAGVGDLIFEAESAEATIHAEQGSHNFQLEVHLGSDTRVSTTGAARIEFSGPLRLNGDTLTITSGSNVVINNGVVTGGGSVMNLGTLSGSAAEIDGDLFSTGTLVFDLGADENGGATLPLLVTGDAMLDDSGISVTLATGITLSAGQSLTLLTAEGLLSGENVHLIGPHAGLFHAPVVQGSSLVVQVVPEVSALELMAIGLTGLVNFMRRRRW